MTCSRIALIGLILSISLTPVRSSAARGRADDTGQDEPASPKPKIVRQALRDDSLKSINEDYARQLLAARARSGWSGSGNWPRVSRPRRRRRLTKQLFRLAIANNLFREAEPAAQQVLKSRQLSPPILQFLARTIDIIASADRGAYDESLADLHTLIESVSKAEPSRRSCGCLARHVRPAGDLRSVLSASSPGRPVRCRAESLSNVAQGIGQPRRQGVQRQPSQPAQHDRQAGPGDSRDRPRRQAGEPGRLERQRGPGGFLGKLVPSQLGRGRRSRSGLQRADRTAGSAWWASTSTRSRAISPKLETVLPNIRRFLLDNNVRWPNLINGTGTNDYAKAYGIVEIPSNVLIGRDGTVIHLDLSPRKNLATVVAKAVAS